MELTCLIPRAPRPASSSPLSESTHGQVGHDAPWGLLSCGWFAAAWWRNGRGFIEENLLRVGPALDSNSRVPCRCAVVTARVVAAGSGGGLPPRARHVPRWRPIRPSAGGADGQGSPGQVVDGRFGAESLGCISVAVRRGRRCGKVVGGVAWTGCMDRPHMWANVTNLGVDSGRGGCGPGMRVPAADAPGARVARRGGLDGVGEVRAGRKAGVGWAPWRQQSNLGAARWRPTCR